jgi:hypothetical protein
MTTKKNHVTFKRPSSLDQEKATLKKLMHFPRLFRIQDAEKATPHAAILLSRAFNKRLVYRLTRGSYINSFLKGFPSVEEVACFLKPPAYISCEWALNHHGILIQAPSVCTVITLHTSVGKTRTCCYQGVLIEFSRIAHQLFHGFIHQDGFSMASPEKALLDTLYLRKAIPTHDEFECNNINKKVLRKLAGQYPASIQRKISKLLGIS